MSKGDKHYAVCCYAKRHNVECQYAECIMMSVMLLSVIILSVNTPIVTAPPKQFFSQYQPS